MIETTVIDDNTLRLGFHRLKGLRSTTSERILEERSQSHFTSLNNFLHRVAPNKKERRILAAIGALNELPEIEHRRDALWQSEQLPFNDLFAQQENSKEQILDMMQPAERLETDFALQGASLGPHPMRLWRQAQTNSQLVTSDDLKRLCHGTPLSIAGMVICRQRPGTAKGHCFISLEDEYGIANLFVPRKTFKHFRLTIISESFLLCHGRLQITEGKQPTVYVTSVTPLSEAPGMASSSHDFH